MKVFVFVVFAAMTFAGNSYAQKKTDREQDGLIGAVHKIRSEWTEAGEKRWTDVVYDEKGNKVSREDFVTNGQLGKLSFKYDSFGKLLESTNIIGSQRYKTEYSYDDRGNLIAKANYDSGDSPGRSVYKYDANGNNTEALLYDAKGALYTKIISSFDADAKLTKSIIYNGDHSIKEILIQVYDKKGGKTATHHLNDKEGLISKEIVDEKGRLIEIIKYDKSGQISGKQVTSYDRYGSVEEVSQYDGKGSLEFVQMHKYEVDSNGNWVKKSVSIKDKNGKINPTPNGAMTRAITYY